jgi:signal transduction histidine kinase
MKIPAQGKVLELLLIEDDEIDREMVHRLLDSDYVVHEATTGNQALLLLETLPQIDSVLLDYRLPDQDGLELLATFVDRNIPVVVLTGEESIEVVVRAMQQGAQDYLVKDHISRASLDYAIANAIEKVTMRVELKEKQDRLIAQAADLEEKNRQVRDLASALTLAEQRERRHIAQILHDYIQQMLYGIQMRTHLVSMDVSSTAQPEIHEHLQEINNLLQQAIQATRTLTVELSPPVMKDEGLGAVFQWLASQMQETHGLALELDIQTDSRAPNEDLHVLICQLVRELLFNVVKHAHVHQARLSLTEANDQLLIRVEDKGVGFDPFKVIDQARMSGFGLYSIRERLALFGGRLEIVSHPGDGAQITIVVPVEEKQRITKDD